MPVVVSDTTEVTPRVSNLSSRPALPVNTLSISYLVFFFYIIPQACRQLSDQPSLLPVGGPLRPCRLLRSPLLDQLSRVRVMPDPELSRLPMSMQGVPEVQELSGGGQLGSVCPDCPDGTN